MTQEERIIAAKAFWIFAVWHDGAQVVGAMNKPLVSAQREMLSGSMDDLMDQAYICREATP
jgi:hypothetical protein